MAVGRACSCAFFHADVACVAINEIRVEAAGPIAQAIPNTVPFGMPVGPMVVRVCRQEVVNQAESLVSMLGLHVESDAPRWLFIAHVPDPLEAAA
jgi:hypothetical protein